MPSTSWHAVSVKETLAALRTQRGGLTQREAAARLRRWGYNELGTVRTRTSWQVFFSQFTSPLTYVLVVATGIAGYTGQLVDAASILAILLLNTAIGYVQESRAEESLRGIQAYFAPKATVLRDGDTRTVPARDLVPGDIVIVGEGAVVPADIRLLQAISLHSDESALTGESVAVEKTTRPLAHDVPLGRQANLAFAGTHVTAGHGVGIVTDTGKRTVFGTLVAETAVLESATPLTRQLNQLGRLSVIAVLVVSAIIVAVGLLQQRDSLSLLFTVIATAVSAVPEGLPVLVTVSLALGVRRLTRRQIAVRQLASLETLGQVDTIVSDKTGTLTKHELAVQRIYTGTGDRIDVDPHRANRTSDREHQAAAAILELGLLASNATADQAGQRSADQTELALLNAGTKLGLDVAALRIAFERVAEVPFSSERRFMATLHKTTRAAVYRIALKGSVATVLDRCTHVWTPDGTTALSDRRRRLLAAEAESVAGEGFRILAFATGSTRQRQLAHSVRDLTFAGFAAMLDAPRAEARDAIAAAMHDGIRVVVATGDGPATTTTVARQLGILGSRSVGAQSGSALAALSDPELHQLVRTHAVFSEVSPDLKLRIVQALKDDGATVAVTGDGANDAPILKAADIGIAMGSGATDFAQNVADMVLLDNDFSALPVAIQEGRRVLGTLRRAVWYLACTNLSELFLLTVTLAAGLPLPLLPTQILWINIITDGIAVSGLLFEPLHSKQDGTGTFLLTDALVRRALVVSVAITALSWWMYALALQTTGSLPVARTTVFLGMALLHLIVLAMARSLTKPLRIVSWSKNPRLLWLIGLSLALTGLIAVVPGLQRVFHTAPIGIGQTGSVIVAGILLAGLLEAQKAMKRFKA